MHETGTQKRKYTEANEEEKKSNLRCKYIKHMDINLPNQEMGPYFQLNDLFVMDV